MPLPGVVTIVLGLVATASLASCVGVIAVQLWQASLALAEVDRALAELPPGLTAVEPMLDALNGSLARMAVAVSSSVPAVG